MYYFKKQLKTLKSVGFTPQNWVFEIATKLILNKSQSASQSGTNNRLVHLINNLINNAQQSEFTFSADLLQSSSAKLTTTLHHYGICVLTDFIPPDVAEAACQQMKEYFANPGYVHPRHSRISEWGEEEHFIWQTDYAWSDNYLKVANAAKPVINIRARDNNDDDAGMVDIFNIEKLCINANLTQVQACLDAMQDSTISELLSSHSRYPQRQAHLYYNQGVTRTRGPHIDNNSDPFKLFVYLTPVKEEKDGPYCYLPGSHKNRSWMSIERLKNAIEDLPSTEVSSCPRDKMVKLFGKAGTAIITNQSGIHCGWPQEPDGERMLLVSNYY